jgi:hypothetical protein
MIEHQKEKNNEKLLESHLQISQRWCIASLCPTYAAHVNTDACQNFVLRRIWRKCHASSISLHCKCAASCESLLTMTIRVLRGSHKISKSTNRVPSFHAYGCEMTNKTKVSSEGCRMTVLGLAWRWVYCCQSYLKVALHCVCKWGRSRKCSENPFLGRSPLARH